MKNEGEVAAITAVMRLVKASPACDHLVVQVKDSHGLDHDRGYHQAYNPTLFLQLCFQKV